MLITLFHPVMLPGGFESSTNYLSELLPESLPDRLDDPDDFELLLLPEEFFVF